MRKKTTPRDRSEAEVSGYRDAGGDPRFRRQYPSQTTSHPKLHRDMCKNTYRPQPGGRWKHSDNVIEEKLADGTKRIRFVPVKAFLAPSAMDELCDSFNTYRAKGEWMDISCPIFP